MQPQARPSPRWTPAGLITLLVALVLAAVAFSVGYSYGVGIGVAAGLLILLAGLIAAGLFYQQLAEARDRGCFPPPGRMMLANGVQLHTQVFGVPRAEPILVFFNGERSASPEWAWVAGDSARIGRAVLFDWPGSGWSPAAARPCTAETLASALHQVLADLDLAPPYLLVGHGLGGMQARVFELLYPQEVLGAVLVDPLTGDPQEAGLPEFRSPGRASRIAARLGLPRLAGRSRGLASGLPDQEFEEMVAFQSSISSLENRASESLLWQTAADLVSRRQEPAARSRWIILGASDADPGLNAAARAGLKDRQAELASRTAQAEFRLLPGSNRFSVVRSAENAGEVSAAIRELAGSPPAG